MSHTISLMHGTKVCCNTDTLDGCRLSHNYLHSPSLLSAQFCTARSLVLLSSMSITLLCTVLHGYVPCTALLTVHHSSLHGSARLGPWHCSPHCPSLLSARFCTAMSLALLSPLSITPLCTVLHGWFPDTALHCPSLFSCSVQVHDSRYRLRSGPNCKLWHLIASLQRMHKPSPTRDRIGAVDYQRQNRP